MSYIYKTKGTCSTQIEVELDGNIVKNVKFTGGCQGNLQAIPRLVEGMTCLLYTSPSPRDRTRSRMPSSA